MICKKCGNEIKKGSKKCESCGASVKKPFYKKVWFWILLFIFWSVSGEESETNNTSSEGNQTEIVKNETESNSNTEQKTESEEVFVTDTNILEDLYVDIENGILYCNESGNISDKNGYSISKYANLKILEDGSILNGENVLQGLIVDTNGKIVLSSSKENHTSKSWLDSIITPALDTMSKQGVELIQFNEREEVFALLSKDKINTLLENSFYVEATTGLVYEEGVDPNLSLEQPLGGNGSTRHYRKTVNKTNYLYYGEFDENSRPTGLGVIFYWNENDIYYRDAGEDIPILIEYVGYFKNGIYEGYGIEFMPGTYAHMVGVEASKNNIDLLNGKDVYEGYFKYGIPHGLGNAYSSNIIEVIWSFDLEFVTSESLSYNAQIGEFANGSLNGISKIYEYSNLIYEGTLVDNSYTGQGILYDLFTGKMIYKGELLNNKYEGEGELYSEDTGNLIYKGTFINGVYHGSGILYDESGRVLHEGEFEYGDIK